ncbi:MAG: GC-type dockerin domain-anchored protein [Phycisphaerales bacterium]
MLQWIAGVVILSVCSLVSLGQCPSSTEYAHDDGSGTFTIGPSQFDANMIWMNSFDAQAGGEIITSVRVSFGDLMDNMGMMGSDEVRIGILNDPTNDNDPSDAVLIGTGTGIWQDAGFSEFVDFQVQPTQVDGVFYIAIEMDILQRANPARMDPDSHTAGNRSWLFYHDGPNLADVGASLFVLRMSDSPFIGAWMIRGDGVSLCRADLNQDGVLNFFDVSTFLNVFSSGNSCADLNSDSSLNFLDVSEFLSQFGQGCD